MEALSLWVVDVGKIVIFLGLCKLGFNMLWKAFSGHGNIF